jgi:hypothetical protein
MSRAVGAIIVLIGMGLVYIGSSYVKDQRKSTMDFVAKLSEVPPKLDQLISLGHVGAIHSFLQLWMVQNHDSDIIMSSSGAVDLVDNLARKKLQFETFYIMACHTYFKSKRPERCQKIADTGLSVFKNSYPIAMTQTYVELAFFQNLSNAARYLEIASKAEKVPEFVPKLLKKLKSKNGISQADLDELAEKTKKLYEKKKVGE